MAACFFLTNKPLEGDIFPYPNKKKQGHFLVSKPLARTKDYVGALEDLDLALQIEPENPFPQCCRAEADSCSCFCCFFAGKISESFFLIREKDGLRTTGIIEEALHENQT